jgi:hypothetical protein
MNEKPSLIVSVFAALLCLGAVPFGVAIFAVGTSSPAEAWLEGGWPMSVIVGVGLVASLVNAAGAFFLTRGSPWAAGVGVFLSLGSAAVGAFGFRTNMSGAFEAVAHAATDDQTTIMYGATGESLNCAVLGSAMAAGLFGALALAAFLSSLGGKQHRAAFALFGLGAAALATWQAFLSMSLALESQAYLAVAHASPTDLTVILFDALARGHALQRLASFSLFGVVGVAVVAGAVLRQQRATLVAVAGGLLVSVAGLGGLRALVHPNDEQLAVLERPTVSLPLRPMEGTPVDRKDRALALTPKGFLDFADAPVSNLSEAVARTQSDGVLNLRLVPELTLEQLVAGLRELRAQHVASARLVGLAVEESTLQFTPRRPFRTRVEVLTGVRVLLPETTACDEVKCEFGTLSERGLTVGADTFPLVKKSFIFDGGEASLSRAIHLKVDGLSLEQLLDAAHTAAAQERFLALHL